MTVGREKGLFEDMDILTASLQTEAGITRQKARNLAAKVKNAISKIHEEYRSDKASHEAEEARKVARNAAWWTFGLVAAVGGGILSTCV